jgi:ribose/xylose/arabinose/galactoside ABC-type transport system permease subunit/ABC-type multidrug transport system ATPase subunit
MATTPSGLRHRHHLAPGEPNKRLGLLAVCAALLLLFGTRYDNFLTLDNGKSIALSVSAMLIATVGATALLVAGYVDLSIGSLYGLVSVLVGFAARDTQSVVLAVAVGLLAGLALGAVNGLLVRHLPVSPIIATLATLLVFRGIAYALTNAEAVFGFPDAFLGLGRNRLLTVPSPIVVAAVLFVAGGFLLTRTVTGLRIFAIGGNREAARARGVNLARYEIGLYAVNGMLIGVVAVLTTARLGSGNANIGAQFELDVLTAVILGGIAFSGGSGRPSGVVAGVATIGIVNAGLVFGGLQSWYQDIAKGFVLLMALTGDQLSARRRRGRRPGGETAEAAPGEAPQGPVALERGSFRARRGAEAPEEILRAEGLRLSYGPVRALRDGSLRVHAGEVVCLVGDNGAGKSTLIKILSGAVRPDGGTITYLGAQRRFNDPRDARAAGVETVYQDLALCPNLGVAHNLVLGDEPRRRWLGVIPVRDDAEACRRSSERLARLGIDVPDLARPVRYLSGGQRQSVALGRALGGDVRLVILDEPTAALGVRQTRKVFGVVRAAAESGAAVILISHDIDTVFAVADRVVVLRLGSVVYDGPADDLSDIDLVHLMAGIGRAAAPGPSAASRPTPEGAR